MLRKTHTLRLDYETKSLLDIKEVGARKYITDPAAEAAVLLAAFQVDDGPVYQWDFSKPDKEVLDYLRWFLNDSMTTKMAFNAPFEMVATRHLLGVPVAPSEWVCTMAWAYARGFTGRMHEVGAQIGVSDEKAKRAEGTRLITRFCCPPFVSPEEDPVRWEMFRDYNRQDVVAERAIADYLAPYPLSDDERDLWVWDQHVNSRGIPIDLPAVNAAIELAEDETAHLLQKIQDLTGLANPNSRDQVLNWLRDNEYPYDNLQKQSLLNAVARDPFAPYQEVVELRLAVAKAAAKKFYQARNTQIDERIYDTLQIWGAGRTGRWSGRGFQLQNQLRPTIKDPEQVADWLHDGRTELIKAIFG
jgi:DNA polymerase